MILMLIFINLQTDSCVFIFFETKSLGQMELRISIEEKNFFDTEKTSEGKLQVVFNPPYDERLDIHMEEFYKNIGDTLKKNYPGTNAWMITANLEALKYVGLKPSRKIKLFNGKLEARLVKYEMYEGSKKGKYMNSEE